MSGDGARRFTDREVALVLQQASESEDGDVAAAARGLTLEDLQDIAREVGIAPHAIERAVRELDRTGGRVSALGGAPAVRKAVRAVPGELDDEALARLIALVDERADGAGSVSEALGSVRWTSRDRSKSTQVSLTPREGETVIHVVEKAAPQLRALFHGLPTAWGAMIALAAAAPFGLPGAALLGIVAGGAVGGLGAGRLSWAWRSAKSRQRVERLADLLAGAVPPGPRR